jgi:segregation and condensation protein A
MSESNEPKFNNNRNASAPGEEPFIVDEATDEVLRLHLDAFEGPFEVLLYLIRVQEIDIFDIPIAKITDQYIRFLELMRDENLDVAGEFLVLAATLIQIKSKMILPVDVEAEEEEIEEEDPRLDLVEKLLEYRKYKDIMTRLQQLEDARQDIFARNAKPKIEEPEDEEEEFLEVSVYDLIQAFRGVMRYVVEGLPHTVVGEGASVDDKIVYIQEQLAENKSISWIDLFRICKSRVEIVCCFLAILELCKMGRIRVHQRENYEDIRLFLADAEKVEAQ